MKTIEERAEEYALERCGGIVAKGTKGMIYEAAKQQYIKIATEQKQNDLERACETYCAVCYNKTTDCKEFCNDINIFRMALKGWIWN